MAENNKLRTMSFPGLPGIYELAPEWDNIENKPEELNELGGAAIGRKGTAEGAEIFNNYDNNVASGYDSHAEGHYTTASGDYSHSEGGNTKASGNNSHAEGDGAKAIGLNSHAEGKGAEAHGADSHAEGRYAKAYGEGSHAEGFGTTVSADYGHAEGNTAVASARAAHAEGEQTTAAGQRSHAEGYYTKATADAQHVQGRYNIEDTAKTYAHIVGNGNSTKRSNAHTIDWDGNAWFAGAIDVEDAATTRTNLGITPANIGAVPTSRKVNGKALSSDITLSASDVNARPDTWNPSFLTDKDQAGYRNGLQYSGTPTNPLYMAVWDTDDSATGTQPNRRVRSINAEGARELIGAAKAGLVTSVVACGTDAEITAALEEEYSKLADWTVGFMVIRTTVSGLALGGGGTWSITLYRTTSNYGVAEARLYDPINGGISYCANTKANGVWMGWVDCSPSAGMVREFNSGAINVASGTTWTYNGNSSKIYVVTMQIGDTAYRHTFVVDWQAVNAASNKQIGYYSDAYDKRLGLVVNVSGTSVSFRPSEGSIVNICGYY